MKKIYIILALSLSLQAQTLQETIDYSIQNNYQLQIMDEESEILSQQADIESTWADPILKSGINDLQSDNPLSRNVEAMQNQFISISQTIPLSNKLEISSEVEKKKQQVIEQKRDILKVNIAFGIRKSFIEAYYAKSRLSILDEYISFLQTPMELLVNLSAIEQNSIEKYIQTQLLQESYQLQKQTLFQKIEISKERIELIGNLEIDDFSDKVPSQNYHYQSVDELLSKIEMQSPELGMLSALTTVADKNVELAEAKRQADFTVTGGYYQRFDRDDYISLSLSFPLFIRDRQSKKKVQAIRRATIQNISYAQTKVQLEQGLKISLHELRTLHQELEILDRSREKILKLIDNAKLELITGGSLLHYYELFSQKTNNTLVRNKKELAIALIENQITQLLGER
jgi:outer membrane protein TolC